MQELGAESGHSIEDRRPNYGPNSPVCSHSIDTSSVETISNYFNGMALTETPALMNCSDCVGCGKSVQQVQREAVNIELEQRRS